MKHGHFNPAAWGATRVLSLLGLALSLSCHRTESPPDPTPNASVSVETSAPGATPVASSPLDRVEAPEGYELAEVHRVVLTPQGSAVLLQSKSSERILPIFVGGTEALSIDLRNEARRFQRPLTHDLLDDVVSKLGGKLVKVHVDSLRSNTFIGRVFLRQEGRSFDVDARPSDAIALAIGNRVPIFVATRVFEEAGMRPEDISVADPDELPAAPMGRPRDPMQL
jgi:bifunctional DNase/RNase